MTKRVMTAMGRAGLDTSAVLVVSNNDVKTPSMSIPQRRSSGFYCCCRPPRDLREVEHGWPGVATWLSEVVIDAQYQRHLS